MWALCQIKRLKVQKAPENDHKNKENRLRLKDPQPEKDISL